MYLDLSILGGIDLDNSHIRIPLRCDTVQPVPWSRQLLLLSSLLSWELDQDPVLQLPWSRQLSLLSSLLSWELDPDPVLQLVVLTTTRLPVVQVFVPLL